MRNWSMITTATGSTQTRWTTLMAATTLTSPTLAARSATPELVPHWIGGQAVSHLDPYGESLFHLDPYLNMEIRQQLPSFFPGHMEALADF